jgi:hypothetical protein
MSVKAKAAAKVKRLSFKRARKEAQQKQYQSWSLAGSNQRSKRSKIAAKKKGGLVATKHTMNRCDNIGCEKCNPQYPAPKQSYIRFQKNSPSQTSKQTLSLTVAATIEKQTAAADEREANRAASEEIRQVKWEDYNAEWCAIWQPRLQAANDKAYQRKLEWETRNETKVISNVSLE